jgi:hypothetical protein
MYIRTHTHIFLNVRFPSDLRDTQHDRIPFLPNSPFIVIACLVIQLIEHLE